VEAEAEAGRFGLVWFGLVWSGLQGQKASAGSRLKGPRFKEGRRVGEPAPILATGSDRRRVGTAQHSTKQGGCTAQRSAVRGRSGR
jgi:hypothetical protein